VICQSCGHENPAANQFCGGCGAALVRACAACGNSNPPDHRFCGKCGAVLGGSATAAKQAEPPRVRISERVDLENLEGERKTVTALFADIKGSMDLMEDLDPEEARAIVDPALKLMIDAAHRYDGYIVQSTGDGIFAIFGAPVAHEDHPQRALYAALRMQDDAKRHAEKLRAEKGLNLQVRVGVNTGEVVVRSIKTDDAHTEYTPIGHSTSLASRLQALAAPGSIAISETVRKLIEGYFAMKAMGPARIKGVSEPVNVYEVTGLGPLRTRLQRSAGRGLTKFVGREREMTAMEAAAERARSGHGQIVAAMAEAGTGKSRLFYEFKVKKQSGWMVLEAFSVSHGKASAYLPVLDLLHGYFRIGADDDARTRREKVNGRIVTLDPALEDTRPYLFALLGIVEGEDTLAQMDANVRKRRTLDAIKRILLRESINQPLIVMFEDLHWIDEQTQELLNLLADSIGTAKLLLAVNYRPEYSHQWNSKTYYTQLRLDPLGKESADQMLEALLGDGEGTAPLKRLIIEKTEGNPFFMEETVQVLLDEGSLVRDGAVMRLTKPLGELKIPPTVQGILAARIDRLSAESKDLLQALAVIGREFPMSLIRSVIAKSDDELNRLLNDLQLGEFIYEQPAVGDIEYSFKHALTQEVAYNSVLMERRRLLHERIGARLETLHASSLDDHLAELAHHFRRSERNVAKALEYLERAGKQAIGRSALQEAVDCLRSAIEFLHRLPHTEQRDRRELELQMSLGESITAIRSWSSPEALETFARARELSDAIEGHPRRGDLLFGRWTVHLVRGELKAADELATEILRLGDEDGQHGASQAGHFARGNVQFHMGKFISARRELEKAILLLDSAEVRASWAAGISREVISPSYLAWTMWQLGHAQQARRLAERSIEIANALSQPFALAWAEYWNAVLFHFLRDLSGVQGSIDRVIALATEYGFAYFLDIGLIFHGWVMAKNGGRGTHLIQQALDRYKERSGGLDLPYFLAMMAEARIEEGAIEEASRELDAALSAQNESLDCYYSAEIHRLRGDLALKRSSSDPVEAEDSYRKAIEVAKSQSGKSLELRATVSLARLLRDTDRRDEARAMLADVYNWFTEGFDTADLVDAKALLEELSA
jgi:class 3 adenylate cyclase/predicted ATPase